MGYEALSVDPGNTKALCTKSIAAKMMGPTSRVSKVSSGDAKARRPRFSPGSLLGNSPPPPSLSSDAAAADELSEPVSFDIFCLVSLAARLSDSVKSSQVSNPHKSKSSQSSSSKNFTCACGVLWCCSSVFSASGWADLRIIPLSFSV